MSTQYETESVKMEINGQPYYVKSKGDVPYLYDIDTNDEVGYWSSKKGQYVMFSLYNRMMKEKYEREADGRTKYSSDSTTESETTEKETGDSASESSSSGSESSSSGSESSSSAAESSSQEEEQEQEEEESMVETKNRTNTYSLIFLFLILFVYLTLQKEFQSIYFDFVFLILINLLNTLKVFEMLNDE